MTNYLPEDARDINGSRERRLLLLAALFLGLNALALSVATTRGVVWAHFWAPAGWLVVMLLAHLLLNHFRPLRDPLLLPLIGFMMGWGLLLQDRLAPNFLGRQFVWFALGSFLLVLVAIWPRNLRWLRRYRYSWLTIGILLLVATLLFGVNPAGYGAALWLKLPFIPGVYFQPSELLKLLLVVFLASYFDEREQLAPLSGIARLRSLAFLAPLGLMWGLCIVLLIWQRDLGAATLFFMAFLAMLYLATGDRWYVLGGLLMMLVAGIIGYFAFDLVALRVDAWINPWPDADDRAFQIVQSLYAIGAGNVLGQGIGQGFPDYIPVVHSDFVFAAVAEEWGLVGSLAVAGCFAVLAHRGLRIASRSRRPFRLYLAAGITILFAVQAFLIMAGVTKLLPLTGVTLPFMSYGGSSLVMSCVMAGLLLYLSTAEAETGL